MAPIIVMKTYLPRVIVGTGTTQALDPQKPDYVKSPGQALREALAKFSDLYVNEGWPPLQIWAPFEGPHNAIATIQRWESLEAYEEAKKVMATPAIHSCVNNDINPNIERYYDEHLFRVIA